MLLQKPKLYVATLLDSKVKVFGIKYVVKLWRAADVASSVTQHEQKRNVLYLPSDMMSCRTNALGSQLIGSTHVPSFDSLCIAGRCFSPSHPGNRFESNASCSNSNSLGVVDVVFGTSRACAQKNHPPPTRFIAKRRTTRTVAKTTRRCCFFARRLVCPFLRTAFCWAAAIVVVVVVVVV